MPRIGGVVHEFDAEQRKHDRYMAELRQLLEDAESGKLLVPEYVPLSTLLEEERKERVKAL